MIAMRSSSRKKRAPKPKQELVVHVETQQVWKVISRSKKEVVIASLFSNETRRPKPVTFGRDYSPMIAKAGGL